MARCLCDDLTTQRVIKALRNGSSLVGAARCAGIHRSTLMLWLQKGERGEAPYADFLDKVEKERGKVEESVASVQLTKARAGDIAACKFILTTQFGWFESKEPPGSSRAEPAAVAEDRNLDADLDIAKSIVAALESALHARKVG